MKRIIALVAVLAIVAAACGGGDDSGAGLSADDQLLADAIANAMIEDADADAPFDKSDTQCFGDRLVSEMGASRLVALGLSAEAVGSGVSPSDVELSDADVEIMASVMVECVDFKKVFVDEFRNQGISDESATCISDGMDDGFVKTLAVSALRDDSDPLEDSEVGKDMLNLVVGCLSLEELQQLGS